MTQYEAIVGDVANASGARIAIAPDRIAEISVGGTIVLVKPVDAAETAVTLFAVLIAEGVGEAEMRKALEMSLFGRDTAGGSIGLFVDSLIYSVDLPLDGLAAAAFAERLVQFADDVRRISGALSSPGTAENGAGAHPAGRFEGIMA